MAAFVEGTLDAYTRRRVAAHVDHCQACFDLVAMLAALDTSKQPAVDPQLGDVVRRLPRGPRLAWLAPAMSAAAAAIVVVAWWNAGERRPEALRTPHSPTAALAPADALRSSPSTDEIRLEEPLEGTVADSGTTVRWRGPDAVSSYEIQVATPSGDVLWKHQVAGQQRTATLDVKCPSNQTCYLWVAAYLPEGRRITSNIVKFQSESRR